MSSQANNFDFQDVPPGEDEIGDELGTPERGPGGGAHGEDLSEYQGMHIVEDTKQLELATGGSRVMAFLIDAVIVAAIQGAAKAGLNAFLGENHSSAVILCTVLIGYMYYVFTQFNDGQTMGKKIMKIKTMPDAGGELLGFGQVLGRETIGRLLSALPLALGYVGAWRRDDKKCFHDRMFKTHVVKIG